MVEDRRDRYGRIKGDLASTDNVHEQIAIAISSCVQTCWLEHRMRLCADPEKPLRSEVEQRGPMVEIVLCTGQSAKDEVMNVARAVGALVGNVHRLILERTPDEPATKGGDELHMLAHSIVCLCCHETSKEGVGYGAGPGKKEEGEKLRRNWRLVDLEDQTVELREERP